MAVVVVVGGGGGGGVGENDTIDEDNERRLRISGAEEDNDGFRLSMDEIRGRERALANDGQSVVNFTLN